MRSPTDSDTHLPVPEEAAYVMYDQRAEQGRLAAEPPSERPVTERPLPSDRIGSGDHATVNEVVTCAGRTWDMAGPDTCMQLRGINRTITAQSLTACPHRIESNGSVTFQDPDCPSRTRPHMGAGVQNVDLTNNTAFFDRYMDKAVKHVLSAELAARQGNMAETHSHAEQSLTYAKEAQRGGNVPGLENGIQELRAVLRDAQVEDRDAVVVHVQHARFLLSEAADMNPMLLEPAVTAAISQNRPQPMISSGMENQEEGFKERSFLQKAAEGQQAEIALGRLAQEQGASEQVKDFGRQMMTDHQKVSLQVQNLASKEGIHVSTDLTEKDKLNRLELSQLAGKEFDKAYMRYMLRDHAKDVKEFEKTSRTLKVPDVKLWASDTLPILKRHLAKAQTIAKSIALSPVR